MSPAAGSRAPRNSSHRDGLFPALLKHWRGKRGLSQLDLALAADVSSRHISFLETGRSSPSGEMVVRLATALDVPLRHINTLLHSAGHEPLYPEPASGQALPDEIVQALEMMKKHHEPFPLVVIDRAYNVMDLNGGAQMLFAALLPDGFGDGAPINLARISFDPRLSGKLANFDEVGRALLWRLQREVLAEPDDGPLRDVLDEILSMPTVADDWRQADLTVPSSPAIFVHLKDGDLDMRFLTMVTVLQAPQTVMLDELRIETWFPADEDTVAACRALAGG